MKKTLVRSAIVAFGLLCVGIVILSVFNIGEHNPYKELDSISARIDADPTPEHLRDLLNYPTDGAYSYYQMALTGAAFSKHPEVFRAVSENLQTERERSRVKLLATLGARVFEYHPELKPDEFDHRIRDQNWLSQTQTLPEPVKLNGDFVPDQAKSTRWMKENRYPGIEGEAKLEKHKKAAYSLAPLIHRWAEGRLEVLISDDWKEPYTREWVKVSPTSYKNVKPKDKLNTEVVTFIEIVDPDNYYIEITVNELTTREYFTRRNQETKTAD